MTAEPETEPARDRLWLAVAIIAFWLACGAGLLIGAASILQRFLKLWWPA